MLSNKETNAPMKTKTNIEIIIKSGEMTKYSNEIKKLMSIDDIKISFKSIIGFLLLIICLLALASFCCNSSRYPFLLLYADADLLSFLYYP